MMALLLLHAGRLRTVYRARCCRLVGIGIISLFGLMACEASVDDLSHGATSYGAIVDAFALPEASETALAQLEEPDRVPVGNFMPLVHAEPLDLPDDIIVMGGSDTLGPISSRIADAFNQDGYVGLFDIEASSTGGGVELLCSGGPIDIVNSSRPLKDSEAALCEENGIQPIALKVAYDPFVFVVHPDNFWLETVESDEIATLFASDSWPDFDSTFPTRPLNFYFPRYGGGAMSAMNNFVYGVDDAAETENLPNAQYYPFNLELTRDLAADPNGVGFASFGKLQLLNDLNVRIVPVSGLDPVRNGGSYPIKRSLYLFTTADVMLEKPEVATYIAYYFNQINSTAPYMGFSVLGEDEGNAERAKFVSIIKSFDDAPEVLQMIELDVNESQ